MDIIVTPQNLKGTVTAPPSKSYAIRLILAAFLSGQKTAVKNVGGCEDVVSAIGCVKALGAKITYDGRDTVFNGREKIDNAVLDCGESATLYRLLLPVVAALGINAQFVLRGSLNGRESFALIDCLNKHGATTDGKTLTGKLKSGIYEIDASKTSQYLSGLLFALPLTCGESEIVVTGETVSAGYVDITSDVLKKFGVCIVKTNNRYFVHGCEYSAKAGYTVEGDWSAAANILALGAINGESVTVEGLDLFSFQRDAAAIVNSFKRFGICAEFDDNKITVKKSFIGGIDIDCKDIPDIVPVFAGIAAYASGTTVLKNVARLNNKESQRVKEIRASLSAAGVKCNFDGKNISITGGKTKAANFKAVNDHRIIMLDTILATGADGPSVIRGVKCVDKSYPQFFEDYRAIGGKSDVEL